MSELVSPAPATRPVVLADLLPRVRGRTFALMAAGAGLTAVASQVRIPLGFTPVPISLATFAAALVGGTLGAKRGAASMLLYLAAGLAGLPFFVDWGSGWSHFTGATGGYLFAYPILAAIVGAAADRQHDRRVVPFTVAVLLANVVLYTLGALWLAKVIGVPVFGSARSAWTLGVRPFLAGDIVKMGAAGALFPTAWRVVGER